MPAMRVNPDKQSVAARTSAPSSSAGSSRARSRSTATLSGARTSRSVSTNSRKAAEVGTRPAEVWGERRSPIASRSPITFLTEAAPTSMPGTSESVFEPTGWPLSM